MGKDNYVLFERKDRSKDNFYTIPGGVNHVFRFQLNNSGRSNITASLAEVDPPTQEGSVHLWITRRPLDIPVFRDRVYNPMALLLSPKIIQIWSDKTPDLEPGYLTLDPLITYYVNIRNMQTLQNAYRLILPR
jgi:hypothetical protein